ncbi:amino acid transporter [Pleurostoma richardsiae]|uniref:Amino acid transporter n=1 Tax=Pleurostoma richardsiae TaxID=41990 RepID=A0AA38RZW6_9PEZI|nr:amino acid transporter [Pleurostoma richardsiae]
MATTETKAPVRDLEVQPDVQAGEMEYEKGELVTASGHIQELERNFSLINMCAVAIVIGNCWAITGATITLSIYNGGSPGVIYEFIASGLFYLLITASLAELASAIPSAAGVYHWASVTPGRRVGRVVGFFAGYWNCLAYAFGGASLATIASSAIVEMYAFTHPDVEPQRWQVFVVYIVLIWGSTLVLLLANRWLPAINNLLMFLCLGGCLVSIIAVAALPSTTGSGHATDNFVWKDWYNGTGYASNGLVFVLGMFNASFNIGTPDCATHMAEEIPRPAVNIPKAMAAQMVSSFLTTLVYLIVLFYAITNFEAIAELDAEFPLTPIYMQVAGSKAGAIGLSVVVVLPLIGSVLGSIMTSSRVFWTLARDDAVPFSGVFARVSPRWKNPFNAILFIACFCTVMGCVYLGSHTAFEAFVGSFAVLTTLSYLAALLPHLLRRRTTVPAGPIYMRGALGYVVNVLSCGFMLVWVVFYCFPYTKEFTVESMNWSSLMAGGLTILVGAWWLYIQGRYQGPRVLLDCP